MPTNATNARIDQHKDNIGDDETAAMMRALITDSFAYLDDPYTLAHERGILGGHSC